MLDRDKETVPLPENDVLEDGRKDDTVIEMPTVELSHGKLMENDKFLTIDSTKVSLLGRLEWKKFRMAYLDTSSVAPLEISECESGLPSQISITGNEHSYVRKQRGQNSRRKIFILMKIILLIAVIGSIVSISFGGLIERSGNLEKRQVPSKTNPISVQPSDKFDLLKSQINGNIIQQSKSNSIPAQAPGISDQTKAQVGGGGSPGGTMLDSSFSWAFGNSWITRENVKGDDIYIRIRGHDSKFQTFDDQLEEKRLQAKNKGFLKGKVASNKVNPKFSN